MKSFEIDFQARRKNYKVNIFNDKIIIILNERYMLDINSSNPRAVDSATGSSETIFNIVTSQEFNNTKYHIDDVISINFHLGKLTSVLILDNLYISLVNYQHLISHVIKIFPRDVEVNEYGKPSVNTYSFNIDKILYDNSKLIVDKYEDIFSLEEYYSQGSSNNIIALYIKFINGQAQLNTELYDEYDQETDEVYEPSMNEDYDNGGVLGKQQNNNEVNFEKRQRN